MWRAELSGLRSHYDALERTLLVPNALGNSHGERIQLMVLLMENHECILSIVNRQVRLNNLVAFDDHALKPN